MIKSGNFFNNRNINKCVPIFKLFILYLNKNSNSVASFDETSSSALGQDEWTEIIGSCELLMHHVVSSRALNKKDFTLQDSVELGEVFQ